MKRDYLALWSILAVAFIALLAFSASGEDLSMGSFKLKSSGMAQAIFDTCEPEPAEEPIAEAEAAEEAFVDPIPAPIDTVPKTILFVGDSMLEGLYPRLSAYCDASGHTLYAAIWYSSTSEIWGNAHLLSQYITAFRPDYIFICLGANELFVKDIKQKRDRYVKSIIDECAYIPFLWIGPPNWKPDTGINELIAANAPRGCYFKSDGMTFDRKKDGAHPTSESAIEWMDSIVRWMPMHSAHPILLNPPAKKTSRAKRVFTHSPGPDPYPKDQVYKQSL